MFALLSAPSFGSVECFRRGRKVSMYRARGSETGSGYTIKKLVWTDRTECHSASKHSTYQVLIESTEQKIPGPMDINIHVF